MDMPKIITRLRPVRSGGTAHTLYNPDMRRTFIPSLLLAGLVSACTGQTIKPAEMLDEKTGVTVGALQEPIEFVEDAKLGGGGPDRRSSFAYVGPVEWDTSGEISYGLWIHVAPGNDQAVGDIRSPGGASLLLDDGSVPLSPLTGTLQTGSNPYHPVASWGQTAYFHFDVALLKRMASSQKMVLAFHGVEVPVVDFTPTQDVRDTLIRFEHARGITDD
jgi:hypothetical protein